MAVYTKTSLETLNQKYGIRLDAVQRKKEVERPVRFEWIWLQIGALLLVCLVLTLLVVPML